MTYLSDDLLYSGTSDETLRADPSDALEAKLEKAKHDLATCPTWDTESAQQLVDKIATLTVRLEAR